MSEDYMTSRERVLTAVSLKEPDRVPINFSSIANAPPYGYKKLCEYLGITDCPEPTSDHVDQDIDDRFLKKLHVDIVRIKAGLRVTEALPHGIERDVWGVKYKMGATYPFPVFYPLREPKTINEIDEYPHWPAPKDPELTKGLRKKAKEIREKTDYAICGHPGPGLNIFNTYATLRGFDLWLIDMKREPDFYKALADKITEIDLEICREVYNEIGDYIDIALYYDDLAGQDATFMSVEDYRKFVKPYQAKYIHEVKKMAKAKIMLHSDGSIYTLMNDLIEIGADVIDSIQPRARDMEPERLKREFGNRVCFHSGIDRQRLMIFGTVEEISEEIKGVIRALAPGGGYVFSLDHIHPETPPDRVYVAHETAYKFGKYPIK